MEKVPHEVSQTGSAKFVRDDDGERFSTERASNCFPSCRDGRGRGVKSCCGLAGLFRHSHRKHISHVERRFRGFLRMATVARVYRGTKYERLHISCGVVAYCLLVDLYSAVALCLSASHSSPPRNGIHVACESRGIRDLRVYRADRSVACSNMAPVYS